MNPFTKTNEDQYDFPIFDDSFLVVKVANAQF